MKQRTVILIETLTLVLMYVSGIVLTWWVWPPLGLIYLGVIILCNLGFMAFVCSYCLHCADQNCHSGYHYIARYFPRREGMTFYQAFKRNVAVVYPVWFIPPVVGVYGVVTRPGVFIVGVTLLFGLGAFLILPLISRKVCDGCGGRGACPR